MKTATTLRSSLWMASGADNSSLNRADWRFLFSPFLDLVVIPTAFILIILACVASPDSPLEFPISDGVTTIQVVSCRVTIADSSSSSSPVSYPGMWSKFSSLGATTLAPSVGFQIGQTFTIDGSSQGGCEAIVRIMLTNRG